MKYESVLLRNNVGMLMTVLLVIQAIGTNGRSAQYSEVNDDDSSGDQVERQSRALTIKRNSKNTMGDLHSLLQHIANGQRQTGQCSPQNCALDKCCSQWDWCGTGSAYCGVGCKSGNCIKRQCVTMCGQAGQSMEYSGRSITCDPAWTNAGIACCCGDAIIRTGTSFMGVLNGLAELGNAGRK